MATKTRTLKQLKTRIEKLKGREAKLTEALSLIRNERKGLEAELREARAAAKEVEMERKEARAAAKGKTA